jgi:hypothetical protein
MLACAFSAVLPRWIEPQDDASANAANECDLTFSKAPTAITLALRAIHLEARVTCYGADSGSRQSAAGECSLGRAQRNNLSAQLIPIQKTPGGLINQLRLSRVPN